MKLLSLFIYHHFQILSEIFVMMFSKITHRKLFKCSQEIFYPHWQQKNISISFCRYSEMKWRKFWVFYLHQFIHLPLFDFFHFSSSVILKFFVRFFRKWNTKSLLEYLIHNAIKFHENNDSTHVVSAVICVNVDKWYGNEHQFCCERRRIRMSWTEKFQTRLSSADFSTEQ